VCGVSLSLAPAPTLEHPGGMHVFALPGTELAEEMEISGDEDDDDDSDDLLLSFPAEPDAGDMSDEGEPAEWHAGHYDRLRSVLPRSSAADAGGYVLGLGELRR